MSQNVVVSEDEMSIAINTLARYEEFLVSGMESYIEILEQIQENGIQDERISSRLSDINSKINTNKSTLSESCEAIKAKIQSGVSQIAALDQYQFQSTTTAAEIIGILADFL